MLYFTLSAINPTSAEALIYHLYSNVIEKEYSEPYTIYLSSTGGDIDSAIRIYDFLKSVANEIRVVGFSQVDSAAIAVFLAGDKRIAMEHTHFRFHEPSYNPQIEVAEISTWNERVNYLNTIDTRFKQIIASELGISVRETNELYRNGKILTEVEAKKMGIVHKITKTMIVPANI